MAKSLVMHEVVHDPKGEVPFKPLNGMMTTSKREAMKDLRTLQPECPEAYLATVVYSRYAPAKKGR